MLKSEFESLFREALKLDDEVDVEGLTYQKVPQWDSIGHLTMVAKLEASLGIQLEVDDVIDFGSYEEGWQIIQKYVS